MKRTILNYIGILTGLAIAAFGVVAFILPTGIMIGSATGIGRIVQHFYGIPISYTVALVNSILFISGAFFLGKKFAASTVIGTFGYPFFMRVFEKIPFVSEITDNTIIAALYGGVLAGIGLGIVIKLGASTGGTDIVAVVLNRKFGVPIGIPMYILDFSILLTQIIFAENNEQILLGIILTFVYSMVANKVVIAGGGAIQLVVISARSEEIRQKLAEMVVGTTIFYGESGYMAEKQNIVLCVTSGRELAGIQSEILKIDPEAFITISSVKEVKGRGYTFDIGRAKKIRKEQAIKG